MQTNLNYRIVIAIRDTPPAAFNALIKFEVAGGNYRLVVSAGRWPSSSSSVPMPSTIALMH
jgi:hypothetical protein